MATNPDLNKISTKSSVFFDEITLLLKANHFPHLTLNHNEKVILSSHHFGADSVY